MSGYRTLHREGRRAGDPDAAAAVAAASSSSPPPPLWSVKFSPCRHSQQQEAAAGAAAGHRRRLLVARADGEVRCYDVADRAATSASPLDATAVRLRRAEVLLGRDRRQDPASAAPDSATATASATGSTIDRDGDGDGAVVALGCSALDVARNYGGADPTAGDEVVVGVDLDGSARVWVREEEEGGEQRTPQRTPQHAPAAAVAGEDNSAPPKVLRATVEMKVPNATGTTCAIRPVGLGPVHGARPRSKQRPAVVVALGCLDGSVVLVSTGIPLHVRSDEAGGSGSGSGSGSGAMEAAAVVEAGTVHDRLGSGSAVPTSLSWCPSADALAIGRKDGTVDLYGAAAAGGPDGGGPYKRVHRILSHPKPVRGLAFTSDSALLIAGDDEGTITVHDVVRPPNPTTSPAALVGAALHAHASYILDIVPLPDGKRFVSCGADGLVKVWEVGMLSSGAVHTFADMKGTGMVWSVAASSDGKRLATAHDDGMLLIYSAEE